MKKLYFLLNDTRYDNHHGCLTVISNLHHAMESKGWKCVGALPVSSKLSQLTHYFPAVDKPDMIIVNGEGTLHHGKRNSRNLLSICAELQKNYPVVLINALWQDNDIEKNRKTLEAFKVIYTRDKRSQKELIEAGIDAKYAPDLTFYQYPTFNSIPVNKKFSCTDSVINSWSNKAHRLCATNKNIDYLIMYSGKITYKRGWKDFIKALKNYTYPVLYKYLHIQVPPRYKALLTGSIESTPLFIKKLNTYNAICVARYHALCFALQQNIPFVIASSNSHKSEALLEEVGIPVEKFIINTSDIEDLPQRLKYAADNFQPYKVKIATFCSDAKILINNMFNDITK